MSRGILAAAAAIAVSALAPAVANAGTLTLHPSGFGPHSYAAWKAGQGEADSHGSARQALYFQKMAPTTTNAAGVAVVKGIEGQTLTGLSWEHRNDGHCGAGAPRWNVTTTNMGMQQTFFFGCAAMTHSPGSEPGWTKDTVPASALAMLPGTVTSLAIVFDEGTDQGQGFVYLDNITVNNKTWTSAADNGNG